MRHSQSRAEGAFCVWTYEDVVALLGKDDAAIVSDYYKIKLGGNVPYASDPHGELQNQVC